MMACYTLLWSFVFSIIFLSSFSSHEHTFQKSNYGRNFNYSNCNSSAVPLYVNFLDVSPDPIKFGGYITVNLSVTLYKDAGRHNNSIEVDLSLRLKTKSGYTSLCPIIGESLCHYNDLCKILRGFVGNKKCPEIVHDNCLCPFKNGTINPPPFSIHLEPLSFEVLGTFDLTINLHEEGKILGCLEIHFCITNCKPLGY